MMKAIDALRKFSACDISDAIQKFDAGKRIPLAGLLPSIVLKTNAHVSPVVGRVETVKFVEKTQREAPAINGAWVDHLHGNGSVVFLSQRSAGKYNAVLGGIMALRAQILDVRGIIIDGNMRDLAEIQNLGLPVFSKGVSTIGAGYASKASEINVPIEIDIGEGFDKPRIIYPGDIVVADENGVVCFPESLTQDVLSALNKCVPADNQVKEHVKKGMSVTESFARFRL